MKNKSPKGTPVSILNTNKYKFLLGLSLSLFSIYKLAQKNNKETGNKENKYILITGASTGIGRTITEFMAKEGYNVFATVRRIEDGEVLKSISSNIIPIIMDVADHETIIKAKEIVKEKLGDNKLFSIINNAGIAVAGPLEILPIADLKKQFDINVFGLMDVTQVFFELLDINNSKIINMSSISGTFTYPFLGPYAASKHALEALSDAMRRELLNTGIDVIVIQPGSIITPIWDKANEIHLPYKGTKYFSIMEEIKDATINNGKNGEKPEKVAEVIIGILSRTKNKSRYVISKNKIGNVYMTRTLPDKFFDILMKLFLFRKVPSRKI